MALTIAHRLRRGRRHRHDREHRPPHRGRGRRRCEAALKGAREIGFTIISLTFSLVAVLIPLLFMGDVVGRLFREFAITLAVAILISALVSLTLHPDAVRAPAAPRAAGAPGPVRARERRAASIGSSRRYGAMLDWVLERSSARRWSVAVGTVVLTVVLALVDARRASFPSRTRVSSRRITEAPESVSFAAMASASRRSPTWSLRDPAVASVYFDRRHRRRQPHAQQRPPADQSETVRRARRTSASDVIRRLQGSGARASRASRLFAATRAGLDRRRSRQPGAVPVPGGEPGPRRARTARCPPARAPAGAARARGRDAATCRTGGLGAFVEVDRDRAARLGHHMAAIDDVLYSAFGQRFVSTIFTQTSQYRVVLEVQQDRRAASAALDAALRRPLQTASRYGWPAWSRRCARDRPRWWSTARSSRPRPRSRSTSLPATPWAKR